MPAAPRLLPLPCLYHRYRLLSDATKAKENLSGLDIVGHQLGVGWANVETPVEAVAIAPPPPPLPVAMAAAEQVADQLDEPAEGTGGGLKLTGQVREGI